MPAPIIFLYIVAFVIELFLLANVFSALNKNISAKYLLAFIISLILYQASLLLFYLVSNETIFAIIGRLNFFFASILVQTILTFILAFPFGIEGNKYKIINYLSIAFTSILSIFVLFTNLIAIDVFKEGERITIFGPLYFLYSIHFILYLLILIIVAIKKRKLLKEPFKTQLSYILGGLVGAGVYGIITNILLPWLFGIFTLQTTAALSVIFLCLIITYTVIRFKLFDLNVVIGNTLYILLQASLAYGLFFAIYYINVNIWGGMFTPNALITDFFLFIIIMMAFNQINSAMRNFFDMNIIYYKYNPVKILETLSSFTSKSLNLKETILFTKKTLLKSGLTQYFDVIITKKKNLLYSTITDSEFNKIKSLNQRLNQHTIIHYDLITRTRNSKLLEIIKILEENNIQIISRETAKPDIEILFIIRNQDNLKPFSVNDVNTILSIQAIVLSAIERSLLYYEVQNFNKTLQKKVTHATTELKEKNTELQELYDNLEDLYQKEKDLMDIAGHELRTPASILKNNLYLLKNRMTQLCPTNMNDEKLQKYLDRLKESTERQIRLVNTFLESARIENKKFKISIEPDVDFADMVNTTVEEMIPFAQKKNLEIIYKPIKEKIFADMDKTRIREVLDNLINNAIKYTKEGYIKVDIKHDPETISFYVKDSGIGIKPEDQKFLFKKFSRVETYIGGDEGNLVRPGGTGLGLYVAKTIVDHHEGTIGVESDAGKGSTFYFTIPRKHKNIAFDVSPFSTFTQAVKK